MTSSHDQLGREFDMPENSEIIRAVKEGLNSLRTPVAAPTETWTRVIKTELCRIGQEGFGYKVYASGVSRNRRDDGEWLYDVTWLQYETSGNGELIGVPLVAECEWGDEQDIEDDFERLLLARAGVRVMIFGGTNDPDVASRIANRLAKKVEAFKRSCIKDDWLLAAWQPNGDAWLFRYFTIGSGPSATEE